MMSIFAHPRAGQDDAGWNQNLQHPDHQASQNSVNRVSGGLGLDARLGPPSAASQHSFFLPSLRRQYDFRGHEGRSDRHGRLPADDEVAQVGWRLSSHQPQSLLSPPPCPLRSPVLAPPRQLSPNQQIEADLYYLRDNITNVSNAITLNRCECALHRLANFALQDPFYQIKIMAGGGIELLHKILQRKCSHSGNEDSLKGHACDVLAALAYGNKEAQDRIRRANCIAHVVQLLRDGPRCGKGPLKAALNALNNLSSENRENQEYIARKGYVRFVLAAMRRHNSMQDQTDMTIQFMGLLTLSSLAYGNTALQEQCVRYGALDYINMLIMQYHQGCPKLMINACRALQDIIYDHPDNQNYAVERLPLLNTLLWILQQHVDYPGLCFKLCKIMHHLVAEHPQRQSAAVAFGWWDQLKRLLQIYSSSILFPDNKESKKAIQRVQQQISCLLEVLPQPPSEDRINPQTDNPDWFDALLGEKQMALSCPITTERLRHPVRIYSKLKQGSNRASWRKSRKVERQNCISTAVIDAQALHEWISTSLQSSTDVRYPMLTDDNWLLDMERIEPATDVVEQINTTRQAYRERLLAAPVHEASC